MGGAAGPLTNGRQGQKEQREYAAGVTDLMTKKGTKETLLNAAVLRWMHDLAAQGIITTDSELNVVEWNHWMEEHTGKRASEVIGVKLLDLFPELTDRRLDRNYKWALEGQVRVLSQALHGYLIAMPVVATEHGYEQMQQVVRISPLNHDGKVIGTLTIIEDVTERVAREAELQAQIEARSRLLSSEKLARNVAELAHVLPRGRTVDALQPDGARTADTPRSHRKADYFFA